MNGNAAVLDRHHQLADLAEAQAGAVHRGQLARLGIAPRHVSGHLLARRWHEVSPGVLVLHCGPLSDRTAMWVAVLAAGPGAALGSWTALALHGLEGWHRPDVHLVVRRGRHVPPLAGVTVHESRRHSVGDITTRQGLPVHAVERAAIDAATWSRSVRTACGVLAAVVQQRLATVTSIRAALDEAGRIRHRRALVMALADIEGGAQALSEIDLARLCRDAGLPEPTRQRVRLDARGRRRYLDAEWELPTGEIVVLEIDGIGHMDPLRWYDDLLRQAELAIPGRHRVIRLPAAAARLEPDRVVAILARALGHDRTAHPARAVSTR